MQSTPVQLESILSEHFGCDVRIEQFQAGWIRIPSEQQTRIGPSGANRALGSDAVIGSRAWDETLGILVRVEARDLDEFIDFLPRATVEDELVEAERHEPQVGRLRELVTLTRMYLPRSVNVTLAISIDAALMPDLVLGHSAAVVADSPSVSTAAAARAGSAQQARVRRKA